MAAPAKAPTVAPPSNGHGDTALAQAIERHARARAARQALDRILADPGSTRRAQLEAGRDLPEARKAEESAELELIALSDQITAEQRRHAEERARALEPEVRVAAANLQTALEGVRDGPFAALVAVLNRYLAETGNAHRYAAELAWPPNIFSTPEGASEDVVSYRRRWLAGHRLLD